MAPTIEELLASLPDTFRYSEALEHISERQLRRLIAGGSIVPLSRGLYRKSDWLGDEDLIEIAAKAPHATICLRSALARHDLIDDIPSEIDIAIPRGSWAPDTTAPVRWRHFDPDTFEIGRELIDIGGVALLRAAAKNWRHVAVVCEPADYDQVIEELAASGGSLSTETRRRLAAKAFRNTASYDAAIAGWISREDPGWPERWTWSGELAGELRYEIVGGNPYVYGATNGDGPAALLIPPLRAHPWGAPPALDLPPRLRERGHDVDVTRRQQAGGSIVEEAKVVGIID